MAAWEMADGTEIRYEGAGVEPAAFGKFVVRFMSARGSFWDPAHWSEDALAVAFEKRFAQSVDVRRKQRADGSWQFVIRPRLAFAWKSSPTVQMNSWAESVTAEDNRN